MLKMLKYCVYTPQYEETSDSYDEPSEWISDVLVIEAKNKKEAIKLAVNRWYYESYNNYVSYRIRDDVTPFKGIKAYPIDILENEEYN